MNRTIESPFLDRELFARDSHSDDADQTAAESPFVEELTDWQDEYSEEAGGLIDEDMEVEEEAELSAGVDFEDMDTASNEYEPFDPASNEYESAVDFSGGEVGADVDASPRELDGELFQHLVPLSPIVEQAMVASQIASGKRDVNELTNFVFFLRHPSLNGTRLGKGQEPLMAEWLRMRDGIVRPTLARATPLPSGAVLPVDTTTAALATLTCNIPRRKPFSYTFTSDDLLWTARFINGEAGGRDDAENRSVIWAMFNRYAFFRNDVPSWGSFSDFVRKYSTPLQPYLKSYASVKDWVAKCNSTFDNPADPSAGVYHRI